MFHLKDLEYFLAIVECGSFSRAAVVLGKAQPALSRHMGELEAELRTRLLYRNGRGVVVTEAGRRFQKHATSILAQMGEARNEALSLSAEGIGSAVIGMLPSVSVLLSAPLARALYDSNEHLRLRLVDAFNNQLHDALDGGKLDVAILYDTEASQRLNAERLLDQELCLIMAPSDDGDDGDEDVPLDAAALVHVPLVLPSGTHALRQRVEAWASQNRIALDIRAECDSFPSLLQLVMDGVGPTLLPAASVRREVENGWLVTRRIAGPVPTRSLVLATPPNRPTNVALLSQIKERITLLRDAFAWQPQIRNDAQCGRVIPLPLMATIGSRQQKILRTALTGA